MPGESIRPGAVVRLRSGGPAMTVVKKVPACWECTWFDGAELRSATFVELDLAGSVVPGGDDGDDPSGFTLFLDGPRFSS